MERECRQCYETKPLIKFGWVYNKQREKVYRRVCRWCDHQKFKTERMRLQNDKYYRDTYGITKAQYNEMLAEQGGVCACCGRAETVRRNGKTIALAVDHCHRTGNVRALLCTRCNRGIGVFEDDPERLEAAAAYLRRHQS